MEKRSTPATTLAAAALADGRVEERTRGGSRICSRLRLRWTVEGDQPAAAELAAALGRESRGSRLSFLDHFSPLETKHAA